MDCISLDVKGNWALKLGNLRKLKKSLEKYTEETLKLPSSKFTNIDLPNIARRASVDEIMKLLQFVMFCVLNCPNKGIFIRKIMELDESTQIQLMYFIQKTMGEEEQAKKESEQQQKELETLKTDKKRIADQLAILEQELSLSHEEYAKLHSNFQQIRLENERLSQELGKKAGQETKETNSIIIDLQNRLNEKDEILNDLQRSLEKKKRYYEQEISQLRDDLDLANSSLADAKKSEALLQQYKKKVETFIIVKQQADDLEKENGYLKERLNSQSFEINELLKIKLSYHSAKENLIREKTKIETLEYSLDTKDKKLKQQEKQIKEYKYRIDSLVKENEDLMYNEGHDSSLASEESGFLGEIHNYKTKNSLSAQVTEFTEALRKKVDEQFLIIKRKKIKIRYLKENLSMLLEDKQAKTLEIYSELYRWKQNSSDLQENNYLLSEEIQKLMEKFKEAEFQALVSEGNLQEIEELKNEKTCLMNEIKNLNLEKEQMHSKYLQACEEIENIQAKLSSEVTKNNDLELEIKIFNEEKKSFKEKECFFEREIENLKASSLTRRSEEDVLELEKVIIELRTEISMLNIRVEEKNERIRSLSEEKDKTEEEFRCKLQEAKVEYEKQIEEKNRELVRETEMATQELIKQREELIAKMQSERRNSVANFQRAMSIKGVGGDMTEVYKLRKVLVEKEKEITKLNRDVKDVKNCWKQSAKLLKAVWKELSKETKKIEDVVNGRMSA